MGPPLGACPEVVDAACSPEWNFGPGCTDP